MCAINPTHKKRYIIDCYTSHEMPKEQFELQITSVLLEAEMILNLDGKFRFHIKEIKEEAE